MTLRADRDFNIGQLFQLLITLTLKHCKIILPASQVTTEIYFFACTENINQT